MNMRCDSCGNTLPAGAKFCANCGAPVRGDVSPPTTTSRYPAATPHTNTPVDSPFAVAKTSGNPNRSAISTTGGPILEERPFWSTPKGVVVMLAVLALGVLALTTLGGDRLQKQINHINDTISSTPDPETPASPNQSPTVSSDEPTTSDGKTDCYDVTLPNDATATATSNCSLSVHYGHNRLSSFRIQTLIGVKVNLQGHIDSWKKAAKDTSATIMSEASVTVGPYAAQKMVFYYKNSPTDQVVWLVYTGYKYKIDGYYPDGFEISGSYNTADEVDAADAMLSSIQWK